MLALTLLGCGDGSEFSAETVESTAAEITVENLNVDGAPCRISADCASGENCVMAARNQSVCQPNANATPRQSGDGRPMPPLGMLTGEFWRAAP